MEMGYLLDGGPLPKGTSSSPRPQFIRVKNPGGKKKNKLARLAAAQ